MKGSSKSSKMSMKKGGSSKKNLGGMVKKGTDILSMKLPHRPIGKPLVSSKMKKGGSSRKMC